MQARRAMQAFCGLRGLLIAHMMMGVMTAVEVMGNVPGAASRSGTGSAQLGLPEFCLAPHPPRAQHWMRRASRNYASYCQVLQ